MEYQTYRKHSINPGNSRLPTLIFALLIVVGAALIVAGIYLWRENDKFMQTARPANATITNITTRTDSDGDTIHDVFVSFTVNGKRYNGKLNYYVTGMRSGQTVQIYYNPSNPANFRSHNSHFSGIIVIGMGVIFACAGIMPLSLRRRRNNRNRYLLDNGHRIEAKITDVYLNTRLSVNGRHPYRIVCQGRDRRGEMREFESQNFWYNPEHILQIRKIDALPVYLDEKKPRKYYVDTAAITVR